MNDGELREKLYSKIDEIPTLPAVIPRLLSLMEDDMADTDEIAQAVSGDPALTSKVLKVANSAYYGFPQQITSIEKALPLLGLNMVKNLALSIGVMQSLPAGSGTAAFSQENLWIHSLAVATAIQELGKRLGDEGDGRDHLFVTGLLHDIGKAVLACFFEDLFCQAREAAQRQEEGDPYRAERRIIGFDHGQVGALLLTRWKFPEIISEAIARHHQVQVPEGPFQADTVLLRIADAISQQVGMGADENVNPGDVDPADLACLGISANEAAAVADDLEKAKEGIDAFFRALI